MSSGESDGAPRSADPATVVELSSRLVYSLLKAAIRIAARVKMPMAQITSLAQLAYFEELRRKSPRDMNQVAKDLNVSLRTAATLSKRLKGEFFAPESEIEPLRRVTGILTEGEADLEQIAARTPDLDRAQIERALSVLTNNGWVRNDEERYALTGPIRYHVDEGLDRKIDGLNNQLEVIADSVWARFVERDESAAGARTWTFMARREEIAPFMDKLISDVSHGAVDLEDHAIAKDIFERHAITLAIASVDEEDS